MGNTERQGFLGRIMKRLVKGPTLEINQVMVAKPKMAKMWIQGGKPSVEIKNEPNISKVKPLKINPVDYIHSKSNRNVLITGTAGQGKSKLSRHLLSATSYQKVIFSFKPNDEYLKLGYATADMLDMLPNPFANSEAFVNAFLIAFPVSTVGIQASLVPTNLDKLAKKSRSWKELERNLNSDMKSSREANTRAALAFIQANLSRLVYDVGEFAIGTDNIVLDFSKLNNDAKNFYAELVLRQLYSDLERQARKDLLLCIDEAHRLTANEFNNYHTILVEMSREIRDKGMLWIVTQNYSDIPDRIRNQFATQFLFKTGSQSDLSALRTIDPLLAWTASSLPKHHFMDAQTPNAHESVPVYLYNAKGEKDLTAKAVKGVAVKRVMPRFEDRPTATMHAAMLAIYNKPKAAKKELADYLKTKGWITSDTTIYGTKQRIGIFDVLLKLGLAKQQQSGYSLTDKGLKWIDSNKILENVPNQGSDLHIRLMKKTIEKLHESNMLVIAAKEKDSPDLVAYPVESKRKKKYLWDDKNRRVYEIQTAARKDNITANKTRNRGAGLKTVWITYDKGIMEEIKRQTEVKDEYLLIKLN